MKQIGGERGCLGYALCGVCWKVPLEKLFNVPGPTPLSFFLGCEFCWRGYLRSTPHPVTVTKRVITFLVGNPYKPSFATVTGWGVDPMDT